MKHTMRMTAGTALAIVLAAAGQTASADVFVTATIDKTKDVTVTETINKTKTVDIIVNTNLQTQTAAESQAVVNVRNTDNDVDGFQGAEELGLPTPAFQSPDAEFGIQLKADLTGSVDGNSGIVGVNQDVGNMVNQGNVVAFAATGFGLPSDPLSLTHVQSEVDQRNERNRSVHSEQQPLMLNKAASITDSINTNSGVVGVNQNVGNMNNQTNTVAFAVGFNSLVALGESALGQVNADNTVIEVGTIKSATMTGSITGNSGVVSVNQTTGNMNNQASAISFGALTSSAAITIPGA